MHNRDKSVKLGKNCCFNLKDEKRLVRVLRPEHEVVFHMSAYSLKLSTRDNKEVFDFLTIFKIEQ